MKDTQSTIAVFLGVLSLMLVLILAGFSLSNRSLGRKLQAQQGQIRQGQISQQVGQAIVKDVATLAVQNNNTELKDLLQKHGITINVQQ